MKDVNSFGDFVKKFDGAQTLIGQRAAPDESATPDQWKEFHSRVAPKTAEEYKLPTEIEGLDPEFVKKAGERKMLLPLFHAAGLSQYQVKQLFSGYMKMVDDAGKQMKTQADESFVRFSTEFFGDKKAEITENAKKFLASHVDEKARGLIGQLDEKSLTLLLAITDGMAKKFTGEDPFRGGGAAGGGGSAETELTIVAAMQKIMQDPAYGDPMKDKIQHGKLLGEMEILRGKLRKLRGGA